MEFASIWYATGGGAPAFVLTAGQVADTVMLRETLAAIACPALRAGRAAPGAGDRRQGLPVEGQPRLAARARDQGDDPGVGRPDRPPPQRAWPPHRLRPTAAGTLPRPQRRRTLRQQAQAVAGTAVRSDRTARNYHDALCLASTLHWLNTSFSNTARPARRDSMGRPSLWQGCDHVLVPDDALTCRTPWRRRVTTGCAPRRPRVPRTRPRCGEW